jgi:hypothetical protein
MSNNNINDNNDINDNDNNDIITENIDNNSELSYINNNEYIFDDIIMNDLQENVMPMLYQYDDTREDFYKFMIIKLSSLGYSLENIYNVIGCYLEYIVGIDEMDIVRTQIINFHRNENNNNIFTSLLDYNMYNIILNIINNNTNEEIELESVKLVVDKDELNNIQSCRYKELEDTIKDSNPKCIICQFDFNKLNKVRILNCNHVYHQRCIDKWLLKISYKCPICREGCAKYKPLINDN